MIPKWTRISKDYLRFPDVTIDGDPVTPEDLEVAFVPVGGRVKDDTQWHRTVAHPDDGVPALLTAGPDADLTGAALLGDDARVHGRVVKNGLTVVGELGRVDLS